MPLAMTAFQDFIDGVHLASDPDTLRAVMSRSLQNLHFPVFAYVGYATEQPGSGAPVILATYPDGWAHRYNEQAYHRFDAVLESAQGKLLPFDWGSDDYLAQIAPVSRRIFNESAEFGIKRGFTVPIHDGHGKVATLNVASDEPYRLFVKNVTENRHVLHLMGIYLHAHIRRKIQLAAAPGNPRLSPRENECLQWAARGKSSYDIADILGISHRTVVFHIENAKAKFKVRTVQQAIVEGLMRSIISR